MKLSNRQTCQERREKKKTDESHACGQTREKVWFESDFFFFSFFFQSNLSLIGTEASPFGGRGRAPSLHMPRCGSTNDAFLPTYCIRRYE